MSAASSFAVELIVAIELTVTIKLTVYIRLTVSIELTVAIGFAVANLKLGGLLSVSCRPVRDGFL